MDEFMNKVQNELLKAKLTEIFEMIQREFPSLKLEIKWNQPMFIMDKTFIIGFSASKAHISIAPEPQTIVALAEEIKAAGYSASSNLFRITEKQEVNLKLIASIIEYNMKEKEGYDRFWR